MVNVETEASALGRKPSATATPSTLDKRAAPRLYTDAGLESYLCAIMNLAGQHAEAAYLL